MLIQTDKHSAADLKRWGSTVRTADVHRQLKSFARHVGEAEREVLSFGARGKCYVGVSWGKDSVAVADIAMRMMPQLPLVWIRVEPIKNPECVLVRDEFLKQWPRARYEEIEAWCSHDENGWHATGSLEYGFSRAIKAFGANHISGVRAEESGARKRRVQAYGLSTERTCAPLGRWSADDVFAYLHVRQLPIHPAYGYLMDGLLDSRRLRVSSLSGKRGTGHGRAEWEERYYPQEFRRLDAR
jgi:phosphoadenosine phosphosulfate reductase